MKLQQLQILLAVAEHGGIRSAARAINLSQAAVTKSIRLLEAQAGVALLMRKASGICLTAAGDRLLARARVISRQVELANEDLRQLSGEDSGTLHVGITPFVALTALGDAFRWFRQRYKHVELQFTEGLMARVLPQLRDGTLDLAAVAADAGEVPDKSLRSRRLLSASQCIVVRQGHPVLAAPSAQALAELEWVLTHPIGGDVPSRIGAMFARAHVTLPKQVLLTETQAAMTILRASDAVSIFPEPLLGHPETRGLVAVPLTTLKPDDVELLLLHPADSPLTPAAEYFAHCIEEACRRSFGSEPEAKPRRGPPPRARGPLHVLEKGTSGTVGLQQNNAQEQATDAGQACDRQRSLRKAK